MLLVWFHGVGLIKKRLRSGWVLKLPDGLDRFGTTTTAPPPTLSCLGKMKCGRAKQVKVTLELARLRSSVDSWNRPFNELGWCKVLDLCPQK